MRSHRQSSRNIIAVAPLHILPRTPCALRLTPYPDSSVVSGANEGGNGVARLFLHLQHRLCKQATGNNVGTGTHSAKKALKHGGVGNKLFSGACSAQHLDKLGNHFWRTRGPGTTPWALRRQTGQHAKVPPQLLDINDGPNKTNVIMPIVSGQRMVLRSILGAG